MPEIERGSTSGPSAYDALRPPELPARPAVGFQNRNVTVRADARHESLWGRPVGENARRSPAAHQQTELRARSISVAPSSSERLLPGRRPESGEHTYEPLRATESPQHVYQQLDVRTRTLSAEPQHGISSSDSAVDNPVYHVGPQEPAAEEPHYEFGPQEPDADPQHGVSSSDSGVDNPVYQAGPQEPAAEERPYEFGPQEATDEEPHYEFAPRDASDEEHIYEDPRNAIYESPAPSGLGNLNRLGVYLVNGLENGAIPHELKDDLQTAVVYAKQLDQDIGRAATLLDKLNEPKGKLTESERQEVQSLVASNKHNLGVVQAWLAGRQEELAQAGDLTPETRALFHALQTRIADRHMDLADLTCLYDLDEAPPEEPVSREDRCNAHLLDAQAAVAVARNLQDVDPTVKERLVTDLEQHRDLLANLKDAAGGRLEVPGNGRLALAGKELWETPVPLQKSGAGGDRDIAGLRARWRDAGPGQASPLPAAHPKVGQARMLQEFIRFRLGEAGVPKDGTPDLKRQFHEARNQVINRQPWGEVTNRIRTSMPGEPDHALNVDSRIVPGKAFAAHFPESYPANGINCSDRTQYKHVPNLAQTTLTNSSGEVLFSGFRHGVLDPYDIDAKHLASLPDASLRTMIDDLLARDVPADASREAFVEERLALIRSDPKAAERAAEAMRAQAGRDMASEMAVAALVADPDKLQEALDGKTVDVALSSISVLTPDSLRNLTGKARADERTMLNHQTAALGQLANRGPVELRVRGDDRELHTVKVNVRVRQFNFGVNAGAVGRARVGPVSIPSQTPGWRNLMGWGFAMERNNPQLQQLFGQANANELGGDVGDRLFLMRREAEQLAGEVEDIDDYIGMREGEDTSDLDEEAAALRAQLTSVNKRIETLDSAARQAKAIWASNDYRAGGGDPFKMVSRLALIGHAMGETPLFNCKSGKDRSGQLDAEVKFLAAAADESGGSVPPPGESMETWRPVRNEFVFNTGNLEMQRLNTGLPGYKLKGVPGLANVIRDGMKPLYRGGSAYVSG